MKETMSHIICGMCSKSYNDPRFLPCLHSFCQQCLHHEIEKSGSQQVLKCPTCEQNMSIPVGGASVLPQNLHLGFEAEVSGYVSKIVSNSEVCCDECIDGQNGPAVVFCCTCCEFLCQLCHAHHKSNRKLSKHKVVGLDQEGAKQLQTTMKPREQYCSQPNHQDNQLNFYCETCNMMVCADCSKADHKDHGVNELSTAAEARRGDIRGTLQYLLDTLAGVIDANKKTVNHVETSKQEVKVAINQAFQMLYETLDERKRALLSELEYIALTQVTSLTLQKEQLDKIQQDIGHYSEVTSHILQTHTDHELIAIGSLMCNELNATLRKVKNESFKTKHCGLICANVQTNFLILELSKIGDIIDQSPIPCKSIVTFLSVSRISTKSLMKLDTRMLNGERCSHSGVQVEAEMRSKANTGAVVYGEVEDHGDGTYTITITPQTTGPHQLFITMNGQHVQNSPHDLDVRCKRDYLTLCTAQQVIMLKDPCSIAIHDNGDIYVGSEDGHIYMYDQTGGLVNTIGSHGSGKGQFKYPSGICIKGDVFYVADKQNHCIQKLTSRGDFLHKFGENGSGWRQFEKPTAVIVDSNNRLIVLDSGNYRIQIFDEDGSRLLRSISLRDYYNWSVGCFALDPQGNIHLAASNINIFTKEGVYVSKYGDQLHPSGIAIDDEGYSLVSESSCVSIYDPKGNYINALRANHPKCTALDLRYGNMYFASGNTVLKYYI